MLGFLFETLGKTVKGTVELTTSAIATVVDEVVSIPEAFTKGYDNGFGEDMDDEHEVAGKVDDTPSFAKKGAA